MRLEALPRVDEARQPRAHPLASSPARRSRRRVSWAWRSRKLAGAAHEIGSLGTQADLLLPLRLQAVAGRRSSAARCSSRRCLELGRRRLPVCHEHLCLARRFSQEPLAGCNAVQALGGEAQILVEAPFLGDQLAELYPELLAALEEPLQLALDLLHRLAEVGEAVIALLEQDALSRRARGVLGRLGPKRELGDPDARLDERGRAARPRSAERA